MTARIAAAGLSPVYSDWELEATNLATNPSFEQATAATVEIRRNRPTNPAVTTNETGWNAWSGTAVTSASRPTTGGPTNGAFRRATITTPGTTVDTSAMLSMDPVDVVAGQVLTLSLYVRASKAIQVTPVMDNYVRATSTSVGVISGSTTLLAANVWTRVAVTGTVPATATVSRIRVTFNTSTLIAGDTVDMTNYLSEVSGVLGDYFDGATLPAGDFTYAWTGTANNSASVQYGTAVPGTAVANQAKVIASSEWAASGAKSLRGIPFGPSLAGEGWIIVAGSPGSGMAGLGVTLVAGKTYTVRVKCRLASPQLTTHNNARQIQALWNTASGWAGWSMATSNIAPNAAGVTELAVTFTLPSNAVWAGVRLGIGGGDAGGDVWWDDLLIVEGVYDGPYFDGSSTDSEFFDFEWTGTADASTSTLETRVRTFTPWTDPLTILGYETTREGRNLVHDLIGGGIAVALIAPRPRSGELQLLYPPDQEAEAWAALALHANETTFALTDSDRPSVGMTYVVGSGGVRLGLDDQTRDVWVVTVSYQEVIP